VSKQEQEQIASFDDLMAVDDLETVYIALPEPYKGGVKVRPLAMVEMKQINKDATRNKSVDAEIAERLLIQRSLVAPELSAEQIAALATKNYRLLKAISEAVSKVNRFGQPEEAAKEAEAEFQG
jgi:hypothetical protein